MPQTDIEAAPADTDTPPSPAGTPGEVLRRLFMMPLGLTAYRISKEMSVPPITVSEILRGKRAISAVMACRLGVYFGVDPQFWLSLQALYDLQVALRNGAADGVDRSDALDGQSIVIREVSAPDAGPGARRWQVMLVRQASANLHNGRLPLPPQPQESPTAKPVAASARPARATAARRKPRAKAAA